MTEPTVAEPVLLNAEERETIRRALSCYAGGNEHEPTLRAIYRLQAKFPCPGHAFTKQPNFCDICGSRQVDCT